MIAIRRKTREARRHELAVVRQQKAADVAAARPVNDWQRQREIECARMDSARRRQVG